MDSEYGIAFIQFAASRYAHQPPPVRKHDVASKGAGDSSPRHRAAPRRTHVHECNEHVSELFVRMGHWRHLCDAATTSRG
eukprot:12360380-Prorocentrum_lima.AAC.1